MCVIGAGRRAARGETAAQILGRYYPGLALEDLSRVQPGVAPRDSSRFPVQPAVSPRASIAPLPPAPPPVRAAAPPALVRALVATGAPVKEVELARMAGEAQEQIAARLGLAPSPLTVRLHASIEGFRQATRQPWWVSAQVRGREIELAPVTLLEQREGLERVVARSVAEALLSSALEDRHTWVRVGAARYFTRTAPGSVEGRVRCPDDVELTGAVSAAAQREAEARAEACFAQALERSGDWRSVR